MSQRGSNGSKGHSPMSPAAASRIQSATAKGGGQVSKGSFAARAQSAAARCGGKGGGGGKK